MAKTLEGKYYINGKDAYLEYGLVFEKGAFDSLLMFPETKPGYSEEYEDQTGTDYMAYPDTVVNSLSIDVPFLLLAANRADFINKYNKIRDLFLPGKYFVIEVPTLSMAFTLRYSKMTSFKKVTQLKELEKVGAKLTMTLIDDKPDSRSIFKNAIAAAKAAGYTVDEAMFQAAVSADLPYSYQKEAEVILAPGISKSGKVAGVDRNGNIVEFAATRAGVATYIGKDGLLKTAAANESRVDWSDGVPRLLIEGASTNLLQYSRKFSSSYWNTSNITETDSAAIGRDGLLSATKCVIDTSSSAFIYNNIAAPVTAGSVISFSFWAKKGTKKNGYIFTVFDADNTSLIIYPSTDYSSLINEREWSQVQATFTVPAGTSNIRLYLHRSASEIAGLTFFVTDAQVEVSSSPTSTIVTNGATVTRIADNVLNVGDLAPYLDCTCFINSVSKGVNAPSRAVLASRGGTTGTIFGLTSLTTVYSQDTTTGLTNSSFNGKGISKWGGSTKDLITSGTVVKGSYSGTMGVNGTINIGGGGGLVGMRLSCFAIFSRKFTDNESIPLTK